MRDRYDTAMMQSTSHPPREPTPGQFSLRTLFALLTLAGIVTAAFIWGQFTGIFTYLACLLLLLSYWRHRALRHLIDQPDPPSHLRLTDPALVTLATIGIAAAAAIVFCCTCSVVQIPFVGMVAENDESGLAAANRIFNTGLLLSIPCGTLAALFIFWGFWPRSRPN
jgi:hypothetical protein